MNMKQNLVKVMPAHCVRKRVLFLFQAELSLDRCRDVQELRTYYDHVWPGHSIESFLAAWPSGKIVLPRCSVGIAGMGVTRLRALLQWFVLKNIYLTTYQIEESESCIREFLNVLRSADICEKSSLISLRIRMCDVATSLCSGLPQKFVQAFRNVEHLNSASHLSLCSFNAEVLKLQEGC